MFVPTEFVSLSHDRSGAPVAILREATGNRELKMAVSANDASRIAILNFGLLKDVAKDLAQELISAFSGTVTELRITPETDRIIRCDLFIQSDGQLVQVSPRPGEAIILAIQNKCSIMVHEDLFQSNRKAPSLKEKIRSSDVVDFGTIRLL